MRKFGFFCLALILSIIIGQLENWAAIQFIQDEWMLGYLYGMTVMIVISAILDHAYNDPKTTK